MRVIDELSGFVVGIGLEDIEESALSHAKYLVLDSLGCALAAHSIDKGKIAAALGRDLGGKGESSIIGASDKVGSYGAVLANGELIGAVDYDALMPGGHVPGYIIPVPLVLAEARGSTGKDFLLSVVVGLEVAARISSAVRFSYFLPDGTFKWAERQGYAACNFGAAAAGAKIRNLPPSQVANALGIAGHLSQVLTHTRFSYGDHRHMTKYGAPGWQGTGALSAVISAEMGFTGDTSLLDDPDQGFWRFAGFDGWTPDNILVGLGKTWFFDKISFKPYPCCRMLHGALDCLSTVVRNHDLRPEEITRIVAYCHPTVEEPVFTNPELNTTVDATFNFAYLASLVVHRVPVGVEWQDEDTMGCPEIRKFAEKVTLLPNTEMVKTKPMTWEAANHSYVEVHARGQVFRENRPWARGTPGTEYELTTSELEEKFRHNAQRVLTRRQCERALKLLVGLEEVGNVRDVLEQLTLVGAQ